jgi:hypothetical protein
MPFADSSVVPSAAMDRQRYDFVKRIRPEEMAKEAAASIGG